MDVFNPACVLLLTITNTTNDTLPLKHRPTCSVLSRQGIKDLDNHIDIGGVKPTACDACPEGNQPAIVPGRRQGPSQLLISFESSHIRIPVNLLTLRRTVSRYGRWLNGFERTFLLTFDAV